MRRPLLVFVVLAALSTAAAFPREARADDAAVAEAQQRFKEGLELADAGQPDEARVKFLQAASVLKAAAVLFNLARAEQLSSRDVDAVVHYEQFLKASEHDPKITDAMRERARQYMADLARFVGQIEIDAPLGARLTIDDHLLDEAPKRPVPVAPGRHTVEASFEGKVKKVAVACEAGSVARATFSFEVGSATSTFDPPRRSGAARWITVSALGVTGLAGLTIGVLAAVGSRDAKEEEDGLRTKAPCADAGSAACAELDAARDRVDARHRLSWIGYGAGGVLVAGAVIALVAWPSSGQATGSRVVVSPSAHGGTVGFRGVF